MWISGLKRLISSGQGGRSKIDGWSDGGLNIDVNNTHQLVVKVHFSSVLVLCFFYYMYYLKTS